MTYVCHEASCPALQACDVPPYFHACACKGAEWYAGLEKLASDSARHKLHAIDEKARAERAEAALAAALTGDEWVLCENGHHSHEDCSKACSCFGAGESRFEKLEEEYEAALAAEKGMRLALREACGVRDKELAAAQEALRWATATAAKYLACYVQQVNVPGGIYEADKDRANLSRIEEALSSPARTEEGK